ncbi:MAG: peroxide stress protein YaaA [Janthinobacterium lividum]
MLIVLSPAKTLDYTTPAATDQHGKPDFIKQSAELIDTLRLLTPAQIGSMMHVSDPLAQLNAERFASWSPRFTKHNSKQAVLAFNGDVYDGLDASTLSEPQLMHAQAHLRILSGLYGLLRPLDWMQPYRLEMGTRLQNPRGRDLYAFWGDSVTLALNKQVAKVKARALINLASEEYFKVVQPALLTVPVITPVFEDWKNGQYKIISFYAKRARGSMARHATVRHLTDPEKLKNFETDGYAYNERASTPARWVFRRKP